MNMTTSGIASDWIGKLWPRHELSVDELMIVEKGVRYCSPQAIEDGLKSYRLDHAYRTPNQLHKLIDAVRAVERRLTAPDTDRLPAVHGDPSEAARAILRRDTTWSAEVDGRDPAYRYAVEQESKRIFEAVRDRMRGLHPDDLASLRDEVLASDEVAHDVRFGIPGTSRRGTLRSLDKRDPIGPDGAIDALWRAVLTTWWIRRGVVA